MPKHRTKEGGRNGRSEVKQVVFDLALMEHCAGNGTRGMSARNGVIGDLTVNERGAKQARRIE